MSTELEERHELGVISGYCEIHKRNTVYRPVGSMPVRYECDGCGEIKDGLAVLLDRPKNHPREAAR